MRHWQLPGPRVKPPPRDAKALQSAVRSDQPQAQPMLQATQRFFPKLPDTLPEGQDTIAARRLLASSTDGRLV